MKHLLKLPPSFEENDDSWLQIEARILDLIWWSFDEMKVWLWHLFLWAKTRMAYLISLRGSCPLNAPGNYSKELPCLRKCTIRGMPCLISYLQNPIMSRLPGGSFILQHATWTRETLVIWNEIFAEQALGHLHELDKLMLVVSLSERE